MKMGTVVPSSLSGMPVLVCNGRLVGPYVAVGEATRFCDCDGTTMGGDGGGAITGACANDTDFAAGRPITGCE